MNVRLTLCRAIALALLTGGTGLAADLPAGSRVFNVRELGARGDGVTLDTEALNSAIARCHESGGGEVLLPAGVYLSGTLRLRSGVHLHLGVGATLRGTTNLNEYEAVLPGADSPEGRWKQAPRWNRALITADGVTNASIVGPGLIDGNRVFDPDGEEHMRGPHTILFARSGDLTIRDVTIRDSANYAIFFYRSTGVQIRDVRVVGGWDGVHFRGTPAEPCRDVSLLGCEFYTGDDSVAGRYWDRVLIRDCVFNSSCNGVRLIGPATHLIVDDCLFYGPGEQPHRTSGRSNMLAAVNLQPGAWDATEGLLDDVLLSNLTMRRVSTPFHFSLKPGNRAGNVTVERVSGTGLYLAAASVESWAASPWTNVVFRDVSLEFEGGGRVDEARRTVQSPGVDARPLPAWAFYLRHVQQARFENVRVRCERADLRPVLRADAVEELTLEDAAFPQIPDAPQRLELRDVKTLRDSRDPGPAGVR